MDDWFRLAPPQQGLVQWRDGRSAKETARLWLAGMPPDIQNTLDSHHETAGFIALEASPEVETELDEFPHPRHHDLLILGDTSDQPLLLTVEAKVDETFDRLIGPKLAVAEVNPHSNQPERIWRLTRALFGTEDVAEVAGLRYQLFAATAGTIIEATARGIERCVLLIHVLITDLSDSSKIDDNASDLDRFVSQLAGKETRFLANQVLGPFRVPGGVGRVPPGAEILLGKAITDLRSDKPQHPAL